MSEQLYWAVSALTTLNCITSHEVEKGGSRGRLIRVTQATASLTTLPHSPSLPPASLPSASLPPVSLPECYCHSHPPSTPFSHYIYIIIIQPSSWKHLSCGEKPWYSNRGLGPNYVSVPVSFKWFH